MLEPTSALARNWVSNLRPPLEDFWHEANRIDLEQITPLYDEKTNRLKEGNLKKLTAATNEIRTKLEEAIRKLHSIAPVAEEGVERERLSFLEQFEQRLQSFMSRLLAAEFQDAQAKLAGMAKKRIQRKLTWTEKEEEEFKRQEEHVKELANKLNHLPAK
jgi:hypothetical protein